jgi:hypothetical protein
VGTPNADFRTITGVGGLFSDVSMQITLYNGTDPTNNTAYADVDRFNPYQDGVGFLGHAFGEVLPYVLRELFH